MHCISAWYLQSYNEDNKMQAVLFNAGGPDGIYLGSAPIPKLQPKEILIKVYATAVNRADCLQVFVVWWKMGNLFFSRDCTATST